MKSTSFGRTPSCVTLSSRPSKLSVKATMASDAKPATKSAAERFLRPHLLKLAAYTPIEPFEILSKYVSRPLLSIPTHPIDTLCHLLAASMYFLVSFLNLPSSHPFFSSPLLAYILPPSLLVPSSVRRRLGRKPEDIVKLDANENPYGPPPEVREAMATMPFPNIYPDPETRALRQMLAERERTPIENILVGCGADELIDLLMRCVLDPQDKIIDCPPTFTMYVFDADVNDARVVTVPRLEGFKMDIEGVKKAVAEHKYVSSSSLYLAILCVSGGKKGDGLRCNYRKPI